MVRKNIKPVKHMSNARVKGNQLLTRKLQKNLNFLTFSKKIASPIIIEMKGIYKSWIVRLWEIDDGEGEFRLRMIPRGRFFPLLLYRRRNLECVCLESIKAVLGLFFYSFCNAN